MAKRPKRGKDEKFPLWRHPNGQWLETHSGVTSVVKIDLRDAKAGEKGGVDIL
ncbi:hypothetical protein [Zavarzinella formosa]|uniref:hypothetical protein n=1 Tax=Zavarzinella formosa TaxID=360055 RepID=UPI00030D991C|nr:hypothetical protein [Zavarzinella formosa]